MPLLETSGSSSSSSGGGGGDGAERGREQGGSGGDSGRQQRQSRRGRRHNGGDGAEGGSSVGDGGDDGRGNPPWMVTLGTSLGWISSVLYLASRFSQIYKNYTRRSAEGLALAMFVMAACANMCTGAGILLRTFTLQELADQGPWLAGSLGTITLDMVILSQSLKYNTKRQHADGGGNGGGGSGGGGQGHDGPHALQGVHVERTPSTAPHHHVSHPHHHHHAHHQAHQQDQLLPHHRAGGVVRRHEHGSDVDERAPLLPT